jgi:thiol-disulfide isomerase/thioredoxin
MLRASTKLILLIIAVSNMLAVSALCAQENDSHRQVGSGADDWWTSYPAQSSASGTEVNHPSWVLDALKEKPVVIYVHKDCTTCKPQTEALAEIKEELGGNYTYYDFAGDGSEAMANDAVVYDPNGGVPFVPLTVILTLAPDSEGNVQVVWHSTEEATGKDWIENYVLDALYYYEQNSGSWKH